VYISFSNFVQIIFEKKRKQEEKIFELGFLFCFSRIFRFVLLEVEQNLGVGVFVQPEIIIFYTLKLFDNCSK